VPALFVHAQVAPVNGPRPSDVRRDALRGATVHVRPGTTITDATVVMRDGWIEAVGPSATIKIPDGTTVHDAAGLVVCAGFIEPMLVIDSAQAARDASSRPGAYWNPQVVPQVDAASIGIPADVRTQLRGIGFTVAAAYPGQGIVRGRGAVLPLDEDASRIAPIGGKPGHAIGFGRIDRGAGPGGPRPDDSSAVAYPRALMGVIALIRQSMYDARWRADCVDVWSASPAGNDPPVAAPALDALAAAVRGHEQVIFDASTELDALRAAAIGSEFGLSAALFGSGMEFRRLDEVVATRLPVILPVNFPRAPDLSSPRVADAVSTRDLATWALAPSNPSKLIAAGVPVALTTARLPDRKDFPARIRAAREAGLGAEQMLAALTVSPAQMLGLESVLGSVEPGRMANLVVMTGEPMAEKTKVRAVWVAGRQHHVDRASEFGVSGACTATLADGTARDVSIDADKAELCVTTPPTGDEKPGRTCATKVRIDGSRISFVIDGAAFGQPGTLRCAGRVVDGVLQVDLEPVSGPTLRVVIAPRPGAPAEAVGGPDAQAAGPGDGAVAQGTAAGSSPAGAGADATVASAEGEGEGEKPAKRKIPEIPALYPFSDAGRAARAVPQDVHFRNATVWTASGAGILERADIVVQGGKIVSVGPSLATPPGAIVVECEGRHITPGIVDCHSHTGIDGSVNEFTQANTAEVRIQDVLDPDDISWHRQLAGGVTCVNQLHGSANPIGGQNAVTKVKWGAPMDQMHVTGLPTGIKFALGENVTRPPNRYPNTRMGVETYMRDSFQAARAWRESQARYQSMQPAERAKGMPPRYDLELEALAEILEGKRLVHCHSYRQDEIVMLLNLAKEMGFTVGTLQHVLEGYKVADEIAAHGAGASCFSDWWAYKMEVMDAIPWAGAMMRSRGVNVSFNSDSDELARRLNTEATKAVKYGSVDPHESLKLVTINPAQQLGIGQRTGSIETGKDADLVVWSAEPLSPMAIALQTWIEGAKYFDRDEDLAARPAREQLRRELIVAAIEDGGGSGGGRRGKPGGGRESAPPVPASTFGDEFIDEAWAVDCWRRGVDARYARMAGDCGCGHRHGVGIASSHDTSGSGGSHASACTDHNHTAAAHGEGGAR
jgi:N-acetylglucosamine-6-phosphate deacetylase